MVKFFGKTRTTRKEAAPKVAAEPAPAPKNGAKSEMGAPAAKAAPPGPPAKASAAAATAAVAVPDEKKPATRRRTPARPPRRDWAAEAAAAPIDAPAPAASSLATAPSPAADADAAAPAKRRRGTRGGRGRKKPGTAIIAAGETAPSIVELVKDGEPLTLERALAHQSAVLEHFARDMTATVKALQTTVADMQMKLDRGAGASTSHPRVGIFVDVPNLIYASERRNINIDFGRVLDYFTRGRELVRASAYAPISDDPQAKLESQRFVHHFVGHPYRIVTKPLKRFADGSMKANFDIELAIDILTMSERLDIVVLMSGDGDFRRLVELIASRGVRVEIVAFAEAVSTELKIVADLYVDIGAHLDDFKALK